MQCGIHSTGQFSAADVKGTDSADIRCAIAQQVTAAMISQIGESMETSHDYRANLHENVLIWTRAPPTDKGYVAPCEYNSTPYLVIAQVILCQGYYFQRFFSRWI